MALAPHEEIRNDFIIKEVLMECEMLLKTIEVENTIREPWGLSYIDQVTGEVDYERLEPGPTYDPTLLDKLGCEWYNKFEKPLTGFGTVYTEGVGITLDEVGCQREKERLDRDYTGCQERMNAIKDRGPDWVRPTIAPDSDLANLFGGAGEPLVDEEDCDWASATAYWTDVYWKRDPVNPGDPKEPNVVAVKLPNKACLNHNLRAQRDICHGESMDFENGTWRTSAQRVKGTWNDDLLLCNYSKAYCADMGFQHTTTTKKVFPTDPGTPITNCKMYPGQSVVEALFGVTVSREVVKGLIIVLNQSPKQSARDAKNGKNWALTAVYYGTPVGTVAEMANLVTDPEKYIKNARKDLVKKRELIEAALVSAEDMFQEAGGTIEGYLEKVPLLAEVQDRVQGTLEEQAKFLEMAVQHLPLAEATLVADRAVKKAAEALDEAADIAAEKAEAAAELAEMVLYETGTVPALEAAEQRIEDLDRALGLANARKEAAIVVEEDAVAAVQAVWDLKEVEDLRVLKIVGGDATEGVATVTEDFYEGGLGDFLNDFDSSTGTTAYLSDQVTNVGDGLVYVGGDATEAAADGLTVVADAVGDFASPLVEEFVEVLPEPPKCVWPFC
jgi:hypothetical protein